MAREGAGPARGLGYYSRYLRHYTKKNYAVLLLGALFVVGMAMGVLLARSVTDDTLTLLLRLISGFAETRREQSFAGNFAAAALSPLLLMAFLLVSGFCAVAQPAQLLLPLLRGMGFGFSVASLYARYGTGALGFVSVLMLPGMLFSTIALLLCCRESLRLSCSLFSLLYAKQKSVEPPPLRGFFSRYLAAALLCLASAALEAALYTAFGQHFILG